MFIDLFVCSSSAPPSYSARRFYTRSAKFLLVSLFLLILMLFFIFFSNIFLCRFSSIFNYFFLHERSVWVKSIIILLQMIHVTVFIHTVGNLFFVFVFILSVFLFLLFSYIVLCCICFYSWSPDDDIGSIDTTGGFNLFINLFIFTEMMMFLLLTNTFHLMKMFL